MAGRGTGEGGDGAGGEFVWDQPDGGSALRTGAKGRLVRTGDCPSTWLRMHRALPAGNGSQRQWLAGLRAVREEKARRCQERFAKRPYVAFEETGRWVVDDAEAGKPRLRF